MNIAEIVLMALFVVFLQGLYGGLMESVRRHRESEMVSTQPTRMVEQPVEDHGDTNRGIYFREPEVSF